MKRGLLTVFLICCVAVGGALAGSGAPAAALRHDPSFSASAQHAVSLHLNLPGTATFDPDNLIGDVNFAAVDSLNPSAVQQFLASQSGILDAHSTPDHSGRDAQRRGDHLPGGQGLAGQSQSHSRHDAEGGGSLERRHAQRHCS